MVLFAVYMLNMHTYRYGEGEGERGGGGRVQGGRGKSVSAAVVCVWLFASSCLHMYIFQITSVSLTCNFICSEDTEETSYIQKVKNWAKSFW